MEPEKTLVGDLTATAFLDAALVNTTSPHPISVGQADEVIRMFFADWAMADRVSSLKMLSLAWNSLRAATLMSRMGLPVQSAPVQRQALESIGYALLFCFDNAFHEMWKARHTDNVAASRFRKEGWSRAMALIEQHDKDLGKGIKHNYSLLIDLGAHPNVLAISQTTTFEIVEVDGLGTVSFAHLLGQPHVDLAHVSTVTIYFILMDAIKLVWPERWESLNLEKLNLVARKNAIGFSRHLHSQLS